MVRISTFLMPPPSPAPAEENARTIALPTPNGSNSLAGWWSRWPGRTLRLLGVALVVIALWLTIENRWGERFQYPTRYEYDSHYILGMMRLAQQGDLGLFTHIYTDSLGAPFRGQLNDFPQTERVIVWLGGQIARVTGLMPAANILLILSGLLSGLSFYLAARLWKISRIYAWPFALVYAFIPDTMRSLHHIGVGFNGLLPLQLYTLWYIATVQKISWGSFRFKLSIVIGTLSALLNVYWIFLFIQLYVFALIYRFFKRRGSFILSTVPLCVVLFLSVSLYFSFYAYRIGSGKNENAVPRSYSDLEFNALKPLDLFIPDYVPNGPKLEFLSKKLDRYYKYRIHIGETWAGTYIGSLSIVGLLALILVGIYRQVNRHPPSLPYLVVLWLLAYFSFGGGHAIFSLLIDSYQIRSTNRYSAAIGIVSFLYFSFILNRVSRRWSPLFKAIPALFLTAFAITEQAMANYMASYVWHKGDIKASVDNDIKLVDCLESNLTGDAMLYILPATDFPEPFWGRGAYKGTFDHYQALRPFLYSAKLRYSYGSHKGRLGADWQLDVQDLPAGEMAPKLESYGFSGILLNRKGYEDRGEQLLAELAEAGWPMEFEQGVDNEWVFIRLTPAEHPVLPTQTPYALSEQMGQVPFPIYFYDILPKDPTLHDEGERK